jgi:hypothetical protein
MLRTGRLDDRDAAGWVDYSNLPLQLEPELIMVYTIGRTREYLIALTCKELSGRRLEKVGRRELASEEHFFGTCYYMKRFPGGSVWASREEAQAFLETRNLYQFAVFGVEASWDQTAEPWDPLAAGWRDLLIDAPVVKLEADYYEKRIRIEKQNRRLSNTTG